MRATPNQPEEQLPWIEALLPRKVSQLSDAPNRCGSASTSGVSPSTTTEAAGSSSGTSGAHCGPRSTRIHATGGATATGPGTTPTTGSTGACPERCASSGDDVPWAQGKRPSNAAAALREDHVARASPNESAYCPVALALREATGEPWVIFRAVGGDFYASENCDDDPRYTLDYGLNEIIARFDEEAVCPTGTLYVDRTTNHIGFLPNPKSTPTGTAVDQSTQEID